MSPSAKKPIRVFIVDDHDVVRQGLKHILCQTSEFEVAGEAADGKEFLNKIPDLDIDVVLMDIEMPGKTGLETLAQLKTQRPELPVIILSIFQEELYGIRLMKSGASGYLSKTCRPEQLLEATRKVAGGGKYITPSLTEKLVMSFGDDPVKPLHETLSNREYQVFFMIASGKKIKEIAAELFISVNTVNVHRANILRKMRMKGNPDIIRYALKNQLVK